MTSRFQQGFLFILFLFSTHAVVAGPNWSAIEDARAAKQEQKQVAEKHMTTHEIALQKLQAACEKVKDNVELTNACHEIMAADAEINKLP